MKRAKCVPDKPHLVTSKDWQGKPCWMARLETSGMRLYQDKGKTPYSAWKKVTDARDDPDYDEMNS